MRALLTSVRVLVIFLMPVFIGYADTENKDLFLRLSILAEDGSPAAQYNLGMLCNNGIGTAQDPKLAFHWFEKAAESGDPLGSYKLGCYYAGQFKGVVSIDADKALAYKLTAAQAGYAFAQHDVAMTYTKLGNYEEAAHNGGVQQQCKVIPQVS